MGKVGNIGSEPRPDADSVRPADQEPLIFDSRGNGGGYISPTITGDHQSRITDYTAIVIEHEERLQESNQY